MQYPLHIALHDGFTGQTVTVTIDGREVWRRDNVRTDLRISRAAAFDTEAARSAVTVGVTVEPGTLRATAPVDIAATPYVAVDVQDGGIRIKPSAEPFHYL